MRFTFALFATFAVSVALAGCGKSADRTRTKIEVDQIRVADFTLSALDGSEVSLSDVLGKKLVVLDFGATWCHYCEDAAPAVNQIESAYADKLKVISIDVEEPADVVKAWAQKMGVTRTVLLDADGAVQDKYGVQEYPTFVLITLDGKIAYWGHVPAELSAAIDRTLKP